MSESTGDRRLSNKVVVVTGGAKGIGAAFCEALAAAGAKVAIADIVDGSAAAAEITESGGDVMFIRTDVTSEQSVTEMVRATESALGPVAVLVNNAAIFAGLEKKPFLDMDAAEWDSVMSVNVRGPFLCAKAVAPGMIQRGNGKIVNSLRRAPSSR